NSATYFRNTGADPAAVPEGRRRYGQADGQVGRLPDARAFEDAVDADLLAWPPGNFDSTSDLVNNPSQIPTSYTFGAWPYGWSGFAAVGWFHGLTTLNNNVHAANSDPTTGAASSQALLGIDEETYLGLILQGAAHPRYRMPDGARPSVFLNGVDPTPGAPGLNRTIHMPTYPRGSIFILDGLMAGTPGLPVGAQLNGMSAWQNTLAPPPHRAPDGAPGSLARGAAVFRQAGCADCHSGRYLTNNAVIAQEEVGTQPSRARALAAFPRIFEPPQTYPADVPVPLPSEPPVLRVPEAVTPEAHRRLAYGQGGPDGSSGGYKVPSLIGLYVSAPYLHDGGVAAAPGALRLQGGADGQRFVVADQLQLGLSGTLLRNVPPDPEVSLRLLLDRRLRAPLVEHNRATPGLQRANVDGSGHAYWVDEEAGFTPDEQTALIRFLLVLDEVPQVLP
ncbi:MAG TPA: hypothetical protein VHS99_25655, partial [Chloroflexota bacterium]|nr:hypothetical protein [Chloroflexota bacterium]